MIDYRLHVFRQVAEVRSLTKASKALHLSQPAVSKHIKLLEEELRVPLFVRSSTGVVLTDAGTIFLKHVQETEKSRAAVMEKLQAPVGLLTGTLRLGSSMTIASYYLPDVLVGFKAKHAAVKCEVVEGNTDLILGLLLDQRIELGLVEGPVILNARCRRLTICSFQPSCCSRCRASLRLWCPASAMTVRMFGNNAPKPPSNRAAALRSEMSAGSTLHAMSSPKVSTRMWRLRPLTRLCTSKPRMPPRSVVFTDWPSMMTTDGQAVRPACRRACWYIERWTQVQTPPFFQTRK